jgi:hypothetical protein
MTNSAAPAPLDITVKRIRIEQLDHEGHVYRTFHRHVFPAGQHDVAGILASIERGYNMAHTRITFEH